MATPDEAYMQGMGFIPGLFAASSSIGNLPAEIAANVVNSSIQAAMPKTSGSPFQNFEMMGPAFSKTMDDMDQTPTPVTAPTPAPLPEQVTPSLTGEYFPAAQANLAGTNTLGERVSGSPLGKLFQSDIAQNILGVIGLDNPREGLFHIPWSNDPAQAARGSVIERPTGVDIIAEEMANRPVARPDVPAAPWELGDIGEVGYTSYVEPAPGAFERFLTGNQTVPIPGYAKTDYVNPNSPIGQRRAEEEAALLAADAAMSPEFNVSNFALGFDEPASVPTRAEQEAAAMAAGVDISSPWFTKYDTPESIRAIEAGVPYQYADDVAQMYGKKMIEGDPSWTSPMMGSGDRPAFIDDVANAMYNLNVGIPGGPTVSASDIVRGVVGAAQGAADVGTAAYQSVTGTTDADITNRFNSAIEFYNSVKGTPQEAYAKTALDRATAEHNARFTTQPVEVDMGDTSASGGAVASAVPAKEPEKAVKEADKVVKQLAESAAAMTTAGAIGGDPFSPWDESITQTQTTNVPVIKEKPADVPKETVVTTTGGGSGGGGGSVVTGGGGGGCLVSGGGGGGSVVAGTGGGGTPITTGAVTNPWQQSLYDASLSPLDAFRKWRTEQFGGAPLSVLGSEQGRAALTGGYYPAYGRFLLNRAAGGGQGMDMVSPGQAFGQYLRGDRAGLDDIRSRYSRLSDYLSSDETMMDPQYSNLWGMFGGGPSRSDMGAMSQAALGIGGGMSGRVGQNLGTLYDLMQDRYGAGGAKKFADYIGGSFYQPQTMVPGTITSNQAYSMPANTAAADAFTNAAAGNGMPNAYTDWNKLYGGG